MGSLAVPASAAAGLQPLRRGVDELSSPASPRVVAPTRAPTTPPRVRVIVTLGLPPLAVANARTLALTPHVRRRLSASSAFSRAYLTQIDAAQRRAAADVRRAVPGARVTRRYRIVLDGLAVELPAQSLRRLGRLGFVERVYPSLRYTQLLNRSPSMIGAPQLTASTGAGGEGIKIAIIDDGIDPRSTFFDPAGFAYPPGFPKGQTSLTTPKVIVARAFPGPGSDAAGRSALDRATSFHGTHVAGIAAGNSGTAAGRSLDHPAVQGLSGVAPRAWLGSYRVFTVPVPFEPTARVAQTAEVVAALEAAVADGMDVINFSGGGPETEPSRDAVIQAVRNVATAGVVPIVSAGNDREDFGLGTIGSPGTAPDAITVGAVSNAHVFRNALTLVSPELPTLRQIPFAPDPSGAPPAWSSDSQRLVDVGSITGTDGHPVDRLVCGPARAPNRPSSTLPRRSLEGAIALVSRGRCTFASKADRVRAAGAVGVIFVDNRPGEPNEVPVELAVRAGMISDLDGAQLRAALAASGGQGRVRITPDRAEIDTQRGGVPASFSAGGPTPFEHVLKPDVVAPGAQVLSATLASVEGSPFAVFDGTSMAAPHVAGAVALLRELHPPWSPLQIKSALMSTAGPAYADTGRTREASVLLEGAGLVQLAAAGDPKLFTSPASLSFQDLDVTAGAATRTITIAVSDAGGGAGTWRVDVRAGRSSRGTSIESAASLSLDAGGQTILSVTVRAAANAAVGEATGFVVLSSGGVTRRIPYAVSVVRPRLVGVTPIELRPVQAGDTRRGTSRVRAYRWPTAPFGPPATYTGATMNEDGAETVYYVDVPSGVVNAGVAVVDLSEDAWIDPWLLGSLDENDVQGYAGTPVNVNSLMFDFRDAVGAAGLVFPAAGRYYVVVDSGRDGLTRQRLAGRYVLRSWIDDLEPPTVELITRRVAAGRPTIVVRVRDAESGVDPYSIALQSRGATAAATSFDRKTGIAVLPFPNDAAPLAAGTRRLRVIASDFQETKNVNTIGANQMPNTAFAGWRVRVVRGPVIQWVLPEASSCAATRETLTVAASGASAVDSVQFTVDGKPIARGRNGDLGIYSAVWRTSGLTRGTHMLEAVLTDTTGSRASASRIVRIC
jgi:minor extracellular serine protease Vpr